MVTSVHPRARLVFDGRIYTPAAWCADRPGPAAVCNALDRWSDADVPTMTLHTSGSTGRPKPVVHRKDHMAASARATIDFFGLGPESTALLALPADKVGGLMMLVRALVGGWTLHVAKPSNTPFSTVAEPIDFTALVPSQARASLDREPTAWHQVRTVILGGGMVDAGLERRLATLDTAVWQTFGMTETISHVALRRIGADVAYTALDGVRFATTQDGRLVIHAPHLGCDRLETNDLVDLEDEHTMRWLGRADNAIESGGIKHVPEVLEARIAELMNDRAYYITGRPHDVLGRELTLVIEGTPFDTRSLVEAMTERLEAYAVPRAIIFRPELERTPNGKLRRTDLGA